MKTLINLVSFIKIYLTFFVLSVMIRYFITLFFLLLSLKYSNSYAFQLACIVYYIHMYISNLKYNILFTFFVLRAPIVPLSLVI